MGAVVSEAMRDKIRGINFSFFVRIYGTRTHNIVMQEIFEKERESQWRENRVSLYRTTFIYFYIILDHITKCCEEGNRTVRLFTTIEPPHQTGCIIYISCEAALSYTHTTYHLYYILFIII